MYLKADSIFITTKRLQLNDKWETTDIKTPLQAHEIKLGARLQFEFLHWTDGPEFDPNCVIGFTEINSTVGGPEFDSSELHLFLKEGILVEE